VEQVTAFSILALTVGLSLGRPKVGWLRVQHSVAAVLGAALTLIFGIVTPEQAGAAVRLLASPLVTIASLMVITLVAEQAGLFDIVARRLARDAAGSGSRLFTFLFLGGTVVGSVFTNDAAVLIFTPLVFHLAGEVRDASWRRDSAAPYYFAVLYVANLVGALVISNPINIIVSSLFGITFGEYARWMVLPALASIAVSYVGLRLAFRNALPMSYAVPAPLQLDPARRRFLLACAGVLVLTLVGFFGGGWTGIPPWLVSLAGALVLLGLHGAMNGGTTAILRGVGWDVLVFVVGIFIVVRGLREAGVSDQLGSFLRWVSGSSVAALTIATGLVSALASAVFNNHPTAGMMAHIIAGLHLPPFQEKLAVFSALVGGDLGPKMLPIGSLAALIWFRILRDQGVRISYGLYVRIGVPVTLIAVLASIAVLNLEAWLSRFGPLAQLFAARP
jgi:arsenical pump membrane protein